MVKFHSWFTVCFPLFQNITHIEKVTMVNKGHSNLVAIRQLLPLSSSIRCFGLSTFVEHKNVGKFDISKVHTVDQNYLSFKNKKQFHHGMTQVAVLWTTNY